MKSARREHECRGITRYQTRCTQKINPDKYEQGVRYCRHHLDQQGENDEVSTRRHRRSDAHGIRRAPPIVKAKSRPPSPADKKRTTSTACSRHLKPTQLPSSTLATVRSILAILKLLTIAFRIGIRRKSRSSVKSSHNKPLSVSGSGLTTMAPIVIILFGAVIIATWRDGNQMLSVLPRTSEASITLW